VNNPDIEDIARSIVRRNLLDEISYATFKSYFSGVPNNMKNPAIERAKAIAAGK
jgi:hypothetical protein